MKKFLFLYLGLLVMAGCARPNQMYYWGDYSQTLYKMKKLASEENIKKHEESLNNIIQVSTERNLRVPPGVYCEYGYLLLKDGRKAEAMKYFSLEAKTYPESKVFIERLETYAERSEAKK